MDTSSCIPITPFVKLEEDGQASILNYNLPQETTYNAISYVGLKALVDAAVAVMIILRLNY